MADKTVKEIVLVVKNANDDYHEAINEALMCEGIGVVDKGYIGSTAHKIFQLMDQINTRLTTYLPTEDQPGLAGGDPADSLSEQDE